MIKILLIFIFIHVIRCQTDTPCPEYNQCKNKGTCMISNTTNEYYCNCNNTKYTGELCEKPICLDYCYNNGVCVSGQNKTERKCICDLNGRYSGERCQFDKCSSQLNKCPRRCVLNSNCECLCNEQCDKYYCNNQNGTCYEDSNGKLACKCRIGYSNPVCFINDCSGYCFNGGICVRGSDSIYCECSRGYEGKRCSKLNNTVPIKYRAFRIVSYSIALLIFVSILAIGVYHSMKRGYFKNLVSVSFKSSSQAPSTSTNSFINNLDTHESTSTRSNIHFNKLVEEDNEVMA